MFGGKTLVLPKTFEEFVENCLTDDCLLDNDSLMGIDENIHARTKDRIIEAYLRLFDSLEAVIENECNDDK
nr:hypothetical protein DGKKSRWO_DGKKSRWO_CDS_0181 [uncultured phage]CAI9752359.1 hypothetical protein CVNMHQAP_CVNMHQAP_CDS_0182 [uncultured phage]